MKRLKSQYHQSVKKPHPNDYFYKRFPNVKSVYHKNSVHTKRKAFIQFIALNIKTILLNFV